MAVAPPTTARPIAFPALRPALAALADRMQRAPLVPVALALTGGILADHRFTVPLLASLVVVIAALVAWLAARLGRVPGLAQVYLALAIAAFGAGYHHWRREFRWPDDISRHASVELRPAQLRGVLVKEPIFVRRPPPDPLRSIPGSDMTRAVLSVTHLRQQDDWVRASGRARLVVEGRLQGLHVGDEVQVVGRLVLPQSPDNPGGFDHAAHLRNQGIRAVVTVDKTPEGVTRQTEGWRRSPLGWLAMVHGWGQRVLQQELPATESGLATALLLGEGSTMTSAEYEKYQRTGVMHVLVISGQHLAVLAWFLWLTLRVRRRWVASVVALVLLSYATLTGMEPPVMRSAATVCVICGGILLRRPESPVNSFALAWIVVALLNPADMFSPGCQLSFLAVAVLYAAKLPFFAASVRYWGLRHWLRFSYEQDRPDPLVALIEESRPTWEKLFRTAGRLVIASYIVGAVIWLAVTPLATRGHHLVSPVGLLIGPPLALLTSVALFTGFLLLFTAGVCWPLVPVFAAVTRWSLAACSAVVDFGDRLPGAYWYVGDIPGWWLVGFYLALFGVLLLEPLRQRWRWVALAGLAWLGIGLLSGSAWPRADELRCTFLSVGHGGCTVLETPDGRVLVYDAGAMTGPDVTRHQIAPFLWRRGIRRIDEVILSHADLDHFNGLVALLERFPVAQVTCTPTFAERASPGVRHTREEIERRRVPIRIVKAGDRLTAGPVEMEVLHPPTAGPPGNENARSLVLLVRHAGYSVLLTGDLEGPGMEQVLGQPATDVDVLMAPHHGSRLASPERLAEWARPEVVISSQGPPRWPARTPDIYARAGARFLETWRHGAVTVRSRREGLVVETYRTGERVVVR